MLAASPLWASLAREASSAGSLYPSWSFTARKRKRSTFWRLGLRVKLSHVTPSMRSLSSRRLRICSGEPLRMCTRMPERTISRSSVEAPGLVRFWSGRSRAVFTRSRSESNSVRR